MDVVLGLDTSCYTTSLCLMTGDAAIVADERIILTVPAGGRGLSQSNMVYQHMRNLPLLFERLAPFLRTHTIVAVCATDKPRRREDSYMPAFLAGLGYGRSVAALLGVPLYTISHQENHLLAVVREYPELARTSFFGIHLSGGTTDLLRAQPDTEGLAIERVGGSSDISAGQLIDRIGVALQLPFPAGVHLDQLARQCSVTVRGLRVSCRGGDISFSGPESQFQRQLASAVPVEPAMVAAQVLATVWNGLEHLLDYGRSQSMTRLTAAGGVMANTYLRKKIDEYGRKYGVAIYTALPQHSADNASGAAYWAVRNACQSRA
jgi:N6-L-threonylcarbamoyladenine synthase